MRTYAGKPLSCLRGLDTMIRSKARGRFWRGCAPCRKPFMATANGPIRVIASIGADAHIPKPPQLRGWLYLPR